MGLFASLLFQRHLLNIDYNIPVAQPIKYIVRKRHRIYKTLLAGRGNTNLSAMSTTQAGM